jgi:hypothetical protein
MTTDRTGLFIPKGESHARDGNEGWIGRALVDIDTRLTRLTADGEAMRDGLIQVLDLMQDCGRAYSAASDYGKRLLNQALFEKILVNDDGTVEPEYPEIVGLLIDPRLHSVLMGSQCASNGRGAIAKK